MEAMPFPFVPLLITVLIVLHDMEHLREWNNVKYVPMKVLRDPNRKWLSAGWLSKQVKKLLPMLRQPKCKNILHYCPLPSMPRY